MTHIDREFFICLFDEFKDVNAKKIEAFIELASNRLSNPSVWGNKIKEATAFLAAHMLASTGGEGGSGGGIGGAITSESVGDLSRGYSQVSLSSNGNDETYALTRYGLQYLELRRSCIVSASNLCPVRPGRGIGLG